MGAEMYVVGEPGNPLPHQEMLASVTPRRGSWQSTVLDLPSREHLDVGAFS